MLFAKGVESKEVENMGTAKSQWHLDKSLIVGSLESCSRGKVSYSTISSLQLPF
jgi:hypothetical protein